MGLLVKLPSNVLWMVTVLDIGVVYPVDIVYI